MAGIKFVESIPDAPVRGPKPPEWPELLMERPNTWAKVDNLRSRAKAATKKKYLLERTLMGRAHKYELAYRDLGSGNWGLFARYLAPENSED